MCAREDRVEEAKSYMELGRAYVKSGDSERAIGYLEKSLKIFEDLDDEEGKAICHLSMGDAYERKGNLGQAIRRYEKSLKIYRDLEHSEGKATCFSRLGEAYRMKGDLGKAIRYLEKSLKMFEDLEEREGIAECYVYLGAAYINSGDLERAIRYLKKTLEICTDADDQIGEAKCCSYLGDAYCKKGDFGQAIRYYEKSLNIFKDLDNKEEEARCYVGLGNAYLFLRDLEKATSYHEKSLNIFKDLDNKEEEAKCYLRLGNAYSGQDFKEAKDNIWKSLKMFKHLNDRAGEAWCYSNLALVYPRDSRQSIKYLEKSLETFEDLNIRLGKAGAYGNLGEAYRMKGDLGKAIRYLEKSLEANKEMGDINAERLDYAHFGLIYQESNPEVAYDYYKRSIDLSEMISGNIVEEEHKIGFYSEASRAYQHMVPLCLSLKRGKKAFEYAERGKSRAILDLLAAAEIRPTIGLTGEIRSLLDEEETYLAKLREIQTRHLRKTKVSVEPGEVERIFAGLNQIYDKIEEFDPEYVSTRRGKPPSFKEIQDMISSQKRNVVLIEYFATEKETFIFLVSSRDRELHIKPVPLSIEKLDRNLKNFRREVVDYPRFKDSKTWLGLSNYLIEPVSKFLTDNDLIYFVPYGLLHYLPLHALELEGEPLIKKHPVAYSPSASLIKFCQTKGSGKLESCASFGVVFEEEAEEVAKLFNTEPYTGYKATKDKAMTNCPDKDVIHFSCHGYFNDLDPLYSGIELDDRILRAREIFDMKLDAELVTLSACQTGLSERRPGDELIGLTRAFLYAGSPSVVVSLWSVAADSTRELMLEFYGLLKNGTDKATALQEAQKTIMEKEEYSHPYYWAPFLLVGDWE